MLRSPEAHHYLAARFPLQHTFAATDLERYASCPFRFFLERVLEIEPVEDLALEFDVLNRGRVVHDVLATFHRRVNERLGRPGLAVGTGRRRVRRPLGRGHRRVAAAGARESRSGRAARDRPAAGRPVVVAIPRAVGEVRRAVAGF